MIIFRCETATFFFFLPLSFFTENINLPLTAAALEPVKGALHYIFRDLPVGASLISVCRSGCNMT
jgi:hypothetical protein